MPYNSHRWKQIDIPQELWLELQREARAARRSIAAHAAYILEQGLQEGRARATAPFKDRNPGVPGRRQRPGALPESLP